MEFQAPWTSDLAFDLLWTMVCTVLILLMQAGFLCLESGAVRRKNTVNVAVKNVLDLCVAGFLFLLVGYAIAYGDSFDGWFGRFGSLNPSDSPEQLTQFLYLLMFCGTAVTIISGAIAERTTLRGYLVMAAITAALIYPVMCHWAWNEDGWLARLGFVDFAGSTVVHATGGWLALVACLIVGPRLEVAKRGTSLPANNLTISALGLLLLWIGWLGFNGGSLLAFNADVPTILVNTMMAGIAGGAVTSFLCVATGKTLRTEFLAVGIISALVGVTASAHVLNVPSAFGLAGICALVGLYAHSLLISLGLDDVVGAVASHGVAGVVATVLFPFFIDLNLLGTGLSLWEQVYAQAVGVIANMAWCLGVGGMLFKLADRWIPFRADQDAEQRGMDVAEHDARNSLLELGEQIRSQRERGESIVLTDEGSVEGQLAAEFNLLSQAARRAESDMKSAYASKERSDRANQAKSQFLANMSHELRTPLNGILGTLDVVLADRVDSEVRESLHVAKNSSEHLLTLLNDLLDTAKMEAGEIALDLQPDSLRDIVKQVHDTFSHAAQRKGVDLTTLVGIDVPESVSVDSTRLKQILMNLVGNALKFTEVGRVTLEVARKQQSEATHEIEFRITDSGIGIDEAAQETIFERFKQADESTTRRFGGTGLGLALCKDLSTLMGGEIRVESKPGVGSAFIVTLPMAEAAPSATQEDLDSGATDERIGALRVLVAEDNQTNQIVIGKQLAKMGVDQVEMVEDGAAAIERWADGRFDVILMDCQMPGIDGLQASQKIREAEDSRGDGQRIPIIAVTANASRMDQQECLDAGMDGHLSKPIRMQALAGVLKGIAQRAGIGQTSARGMEPRSGTGR